MFGLNKVQLIGNLGRDPELRKLENGTSVAQFSIATTEHYTNKEGVRVQQTEWHNIVMWRGLADTAEKYLHKGDPVYIEGKITTRSYNDKEGVKKNITEIVAASMIMLSRGPGAESGGNSQTGSTHVNTAATTQIPAVAEDAFGVPSGEDDDLPF